MAVISPAGVVGRVHLTSARAARVQMLIDLNAAAGAMIERTRAQGLVAGQGTTLRMDYVPNTSDVKQGDLVVTSGIDKIYPKGFVIGTVESVSRGSGIFHEIVVRPAVDFSQLEEVLVVTTLPPAVTAEQIEKEAETIAAQQRQQGAAAVAQNASPRNASPRTAPQSASPQNTSSAAPRPVRPPTAAPPNSTPRNTAPRNVTPPAAAPSTDAAQDGASETAAPPNATPPASTPRNGSPQNASPQRPSPGGPGA
jgi:rod shape-determining protein MreC